MGVSWAGTSRCPSLLHPSASLTPEALPSAELLEASEAKQCHLADYLNNALG